MYALAEKSSEKNKSKAIANNVGGGSRGLRRGFGFVDNRPEAVDQKKMQDMANENSQVRQLRYFQAMGNSEPRARQVTQLQTVDMNTKSNMSIHKSSMDLVQLVNKGKFRSIRGNSGYVTLATDRRNMGHTYIILETKHGAWMYHFRADARNIFTSMVKLVTWYGSFEQIRRDPTSGRGRSPQGFVQEREMNFQELKVKKAKVEAVKTLCEQSIGGGTFSLILSNIRIGDNCFSKVYNILKAAGFNLTWSSYLLSFVSPRLALSKGAGFYEDKGSKKYKKSTYSYQ